MSEAADVGGPGQARAAGPQAHVAGVDHRGHVELVGQAAGQVEAGRVKVEVGDVQDPHGAVAVQLPHRAGQGGVGPVEVVADADHLLAQGAQPVQAGADVADQGRGVLQGAVVAGSRKASHRGGQGRPSSTRGVRRQAAAEQPLAGPRRTPAPGQPAGHPRTAIG